MYSIYRNSHDLTFEDLAGPMGLGRLTRLMSGWGVKFFDYDNDGNLDLFIANGHPDDKIESHSGHVAYKEPLLLFHNNGRTLENVSDLAGRLLRRASRRAAWPWEISIMTALWTSWFPSMADHPCF